ncbi:MAG: putative manganese-dependent inorganic diphosphatase [Sphaerochaetaceae bacterium]
MKKIYVTGHRNPDLDSVASAWAYANLKNIVDDQNEYIPIRIGPLNDTTKIEFQKLNIEAPAFVKDVRAKVRDVVITDFNHLHPDDPIFNLVKLFRDRHSSVVPLLDNGKFSGLLSLDEITSFFLKENAGKRPTYRFYPENFGKVIRGKFVKEASSRCIEAHIITGAMEYERFKKRIESLLPTLPVLVIGNRKRHLEYAISKQIPAIILTGLEEDEEIAADYSSYNGIIYQSYEDTAETIRLLRMSLPVYQLLQNSPPKIEVDALFDDAKRMLAESEFRGLPVFDEQEFIGFVTRRCFLEKPKRKVILVDHNELNQSVDGLDEANIVEIIDHHRLDAEKTAQPIFIASEPVGSTCTIVYHQYLRWGVPIDQLTAKVLLAGIIADTVILKSPTTTNQDISAAFVLSKFADVEDVKQYGEQLFGSSGVLKNEDIEQVISGDFKIYNESGIRFGIGQVEVTTFDQIEDVKGEIHRQLEFTRRNNALQWAMLLVTDVIKEDSILIATGYPKREKALGYPMIEPGVFLLKGVLSRKKQLLPEIVRVLEEVV